MPRLLTRCISGRVRLVQVCARQERALTSLNSKDRFLCCRRHLLATLIHRTRHSLLTN